MAYKKGESNIKNCSLQVGMQESQSKGIKDVLYYNK